MKNIGQTAIADGSRFDGVENSVDPGPYRRKSRFAIQFVHIQALPNSKPFTRLAPVDFQNPNTSAGCPEGRVMYGPTRVCKGEFPG